MKAFYQHDLKNIQCRMGNDLSYRVHFHHNIEVVYMFKGKGCAIVEGKEYELLPGDVLVVFPNQIHEYRRVSEEEYFICIFKPEILPDFKEKFYSMSPTENVYSTKNENKLLLELAQMLPGVKDSDALYREQIYRGMLTAFFGELFSRITLKEVKSANLSVVKNFLIFCNENYMSDITLDNVAEKLHVSKYYISHLMNERLHISFNEYINSLRIADACVMLDEDELDITEISRLSGFNTLRTFNRAFRQVHGMTPTQYKNKKNTRQIQQ